MFDGKIVEKGTYQELIEKNGPFAKFVNEFGGKEEQEEQKGEEAGIEEGHEEKKKVGGTGGKMMQAEDRSTGAVSSAGE